LFWGEIYEESHEIDDITQATILNWKENGLRELSHFRGLAEIVLDKTQKYFLINVFD